MGFVLVPASSSSAFSNSVSDSVVSAEILLAEPVVSVFHGILSVGRILSLLTIFVLKVAASVCSSSLKRLALMLVVDMSSRCTSFSSFGDVRSWSSFREWIP